MSDDNEAILRLIAAGRCLIIDGGWLDSFPSISEELLNKAIAWARTIVNITDEHVTIIKHARKSVLFNSTKPWIKRDSSSTFDVTMGSFDGAEICELVGLYVLNKLRTRFGASCDRRQ